MWSGGPGGPRGALLTGCCFLEELKASVGHLRSHRFPGGQAAAAGVKGLPQPHRSCEREVLLPSAGFFPWALFLSPLRILGLHLCGFLRDVSQRHLRTQFREAMSSKQNNQDCLAESRL